MRVWTRKMIDKNIRVWLVRALKLKTFEKRDHFISKHVIGYIIGYMGFSNFLKLLVYE